MGYLLQYDAPLKNIPFRCDHCFNLGYRLRKYVKRNVEVRKQNSVYCSPECLRSYISSTKQLVDKQCEECSCLFAPDNIRTKFCSRSCGAISSNRSREPESRARQGRSLSSSPKARKTNTILSMQYHAEYSKSPRYCVICNGPKPWEQRHHKTCGPACASKTHSDPTKRGKISETRRKRFADGSLAVTGGNTRWLDYNGIRVQGTYELRMCHILDRWKTTGKITDWEYTKDRIPYINHLGKKATYLLDFKVRRNDSTEYYIETKGFERANDQLKWAATRDAGFELEVWFKENIEREE